MFPVFANNPEPNNPPVVGALVPDSLVVEARFPKSPVPVPFPNRLFGWGFPNRLEPFGKFPNNPPVGASLAGAASEEVVVVAAGVASFASVSLFWVEIFPKREDLVYELYYQRLSLFY